MHLSSSKPTILVTTTGRLRTLVRTFAQREFFRPKRSVAVVWLNGPNIIGLCDELNKVSTVTDQRHFTLYLVPNADALSDHENESLVRCLRLIRHHNASYVLGYRSRSRIPSAVDALARIVFFHGRVSKR